MPCCPCSRRFVISHLVQYLFFLPPPYWVKVALLSTLVCASCHRLSGYGKQLLSLLSILLIVKHLKTCKYFSSFLAFYIRYYLSHPIMFYSFFLFLLLPLVSMAGAPFFRFIKVYWQILVPKFIAFVHSSELASLIHIVKVADNSFGFLLFCDILACGHADSSLAIMF